MDASAVKNKSSSAKRMKKLRLKKKLEDPDFQKKENRRISELKKKMKMCMNEKRKLLLRRYERDRKREQRARKKQNINSTCSPKKNAVESPYGSSQSLGKAMNRTIKSLPKSPRKQKAVISGLAQRVGIKLKNEMENCFGGSSRTNKIDETIVKNFFFRSDIVHTAPGLKDSMAVWENGNKLTLQKHYMTMYLKEAYCVFKEDNPQFEIGFSKFCNMRPKNVLLLKDMPADQCKCKIHENFTLKLKGMNVVYDNSFLNSVLCDNSLNSKCWQNQCEDCSNGKKLNIPNDPEKQVTWRQWEKNNDGRLLLQFKEGCAGELYELIQADIQNFLAHVIIKRIQAHAFQVDQKLENVRLLQVDFAMSYSCSYQNEIQSALWSRASVMLFTAAAFINGTCKTFVLCSDARNKDKDTVYVMLMKLYEMLNAEQVNIIEEIIWSDGPASEFKNKYMVQVLKILAKKYNTKFSWKYFATSHGKGVVDGVGGNIKRLVRQKSMSHSEGTIVQSAKDFAQLAQELVPSTQSVFISEDEIRRVIDEEKPWEGVIPVPGISSYHVIEVKPNIEVFKHHAMTNDQKDLNNPAQSGSDLDIIKGDWCLVMYNGFCYPGILEEICEDEVKVNVMVPATKQHYKWPNPRDCISYSISNVIRKIDPPTIASQSRRATMYKFSELF